MRSPHAPWVQELAAELSDSAARAALLARQRKLQGVAEDAAARWEAGAELASAVVELWLEDKSLEQVLAKSTVLGHAQLRSGLVLSGRFARQVAAKQNVTLEQLLPWVSKLAGGAGGAADGTTDDAAASVALAASASLFRVDPANAFASLPGTQCPLGTLPAIALHGHCMGTARALHGHCVYRCAARRAAGATRHGCGVWQPRHDVAGSRAPRTLYIRVHETAASAPHGCSPHSLTVAAATPTGLQPPPSHGYSLLPTRRMRRGSTWTRTTRAAPPA